MNLQEQLEEEIKAHNEIYTQIQQGETQLEALKAEKERRLGRAQMIQEIIQDNAVTPEGPDPIAWSSNDEEPDEGPGVVNE